MNTLPTLKQLRYFIALAQQEHFGRAAEACFVSQSAFSVAIKDLESLLEVQLVDRTNKQVTITDKGQEFARGARQILEELEQLIDTTQGAQTPLSGKLKLGVIPTIAPFVIPRVLGPLRQQYPELKLYLVEDTTQRLYERLMRGELDLMLLGLPYELRAVETLTLFKDPFYLAYHQGSRLLDPAHYDYASLPPETVLLLEDGHCLRDHAISACKLKDQEKVSRFSASSLFTLVQMVDEDLGITYLPEMAIGSNLLSQTHLQTQKLGDNSYREIGLAWRQGSAQVDDFKLLGDVILQQCDKGH